MTKSNPATTPSLLNVLPLSIWLSLITGPLLVTLVLAKCLETVLRDLGLASEEVFRGDRLPVLHLTHPTDPSPD